MSWPVVFTRQAQQDARNFASAGLKEKAHSLLAILAEIPVKTPSGYEKLVGDLSGAYSRRNNIQHRLVYQVLEEIARSRCCGFGGTTSSGGS